MKFKAKITSQNPVHRHVFSTLCNGKRYDINTITGKVWGYSYTNMGSHQRDVTDQNIIDAVKEAVKDK